MASRLESRPQQHPRQEPEAQQLGYREIPAALAALATAQAPVGHQQISCCPAQPRQEPAAQLDLAAGFVLH
jgi:hypothetical protein